MMKNEIKRIFIIQYVGYGDWLSISGMVRFLTTKYNHVYIIADGGNYDFIKQLYRDDEVVLEVIKGKVPEDDSNLAYKVDGLSGATITSRGVTNMIKYWFSDSGYANLFSELDYES